MRHRSFVFLGCMLFGFTIGLLTCGCKSAKPIHLGSLNENGTPNELLAKLQARRAGQEEDVKTQQATEGLRVDVDPTVSNFVITNSSGFYLDQLSFACDIGKHQFVYFTWNVGTSTDNVWSPIQWLTPQTKRRAFFTSPHEGLTLIHNDVKDYESLDRNQVAWLTHKYTFHDCVVLDVADATEEDPRAKQAPDSQSALDSSSSAPRAKPWEEYRSHGGKFVPLPDGSYGEFPKDASDDLIRSAVLKTFPDAFEFADTFQTEPPDHLQGWPAFAACMAARQLAASCLREGLKPLKGEAAFYGGYQDPLPKISSTPKGFSLDPNKQACDAAFQWKNYCSAR